MEVNKVSTNFIQNLDYTNKILPNTSDATWKKVAKWALIIFSFGTALLVTLLMDLTKKIIIKLSMRNNPSLPKPLTHYEKIVKCTSRFLNGIKDGATQLIQTTAYHSDRLSPLDRYCVTSGYILGSTAIFYLGAGFKGAMTALALNVLGLSLNPLNKHVWKPIQKKLHSV